MKTELLEIYQALQQQVPVVVATIINSHGSTPRTSGSKMIIYADGGISGTIGGGAIEGDVIERALPLFDTKTEEIISYDLRKDGRSSELDLICGGQLEVMLEFVASSSENQLLYRSAWQKIEKEEPFSWIASIKKLGDTIVVTRSVEEITDTAEIKHGAGRIVSGPAKDLVFVEPILPGQTVFIIGGGHVSKEIAKLTKQIGLKTLIFDDRKEFANDYRFPEVDGVHVCQGYSRIFEPFRISGNSYIIIVTRGHSFDKEVLAQALATKAGYIGMMGSRKKRDTIYSSLIAAGIKAETLDRVHCPIGLSINAETPAELAVSIVAEIIKHRCSQGSHG